MEKFMFLRVAPRRVRHLRPLRYKSAQGLAAEVLTQMARDFLVVTPVTLTLPQPRLMAGLWAALRESMLAGPAERAPRDAVAAAVSLLNECPYCVAAHTMMLHGVGEHTLAHALLQWKDEHLTDPVLSPVIRWAMSTETSGAHLKTDLPFSTGDLPQFIGTVVVFQFINRMVNIFLEDSPLPVPGWLRWMRNLTVRAGGWGLGAESKSRLLHPGEFLLVHEDETLPPDFAWARPNNEVARAFIQFATVAEEAGRECLTEPVRLLVSRRLERWDGEPPPLGYDWLKREADGLDGPGSAQLELAMLTAFASHRIPPEVIERFREHHPGEAILVGAAAWASFAAARRIGGWFC